MDKHVFFITGIGTDVGKTIVSAIVSESLQATYWKPIQSGASEGTDRQIVERLCTDAVRTLPENYLLKEPVSPHLAAEMEGVEIDITTLTIPQVDGNIVIEGAGGLMVPITKDYLFADWIATYKIPTIIVSRHYLGSINHTLLTVAQLLNLNVPIAGIVFVGEENKDTEKVILQHGGVKVLGRIPIAKQLDKAFVTEQAKKLHLN